jgi:hypothetical protein
MAERPRNRYLSALSLISGETLHFQNREARASGDCGSSKSNNQAGLPAECRYQAEDERRSYSGNDYQSCIEHVNRLRSIQTYARMSAKVTVL